MQVNDGAGVFYNILRIDYSCLPNTFFSWNNSIARQAIHATSTIKERREVAISFIDLFYNKATRAWVSRHYGFSCRCRACEDELDSDDKFTGGSCKGRLGMQ